MIHDLHVPMSAPPRPDGHAQFGTMTAADAAALRAMGTHNNVPGRLFTWMAGAPHCRRFRPLPRPPDQYRADPAKHGALNCMQQSDCHGYWEFNYTTNWIHPLYELPFTGGIPGTFEAGKVSALSSLILALDRQA